jgi:transmembrane sensor
MNSDNTFGQIDELILAFLQERISPEGFAQLKNWLASDKANKDYFKKNYMLWKAGGVSGQNEEKANKAFLKLYLKTFGTGKKELTAFNEKNHYIRVSWFKIAALVFLSICTGAVISYLSLKPPLDVDIARNEINVPLGSKSRIVLPDCTEVWLNAGSKLSYSMSYGKKLREVNLVGEGYFKVAKMHEKPFIVHTSKANIKALGTEFNVKAYPDENIIETILVKGKVEVDKITEPGGLKSSKSEKSIVLIPGQKVLIYKNNIPRDTSKLVPSVSMKNQASNKRTSAQRIENNEMNPQSSDAEVETSWKDPNWVIQGENVKELFIKLGRRYNLSIVLLDNKLDKYKFSGIIQSETLEQVFDLMSLTIPMSYAIEKGKAEISLNPKLENKYKRAYNN